MPVSGFSRLILLNIITTKTTTLWGIQMTKSQIITPLLLANKGLPKDKQLSQVEIAHRAKSSLTLVGNLKARMKASGEL